MNRSTFFFLYLVAVGFIDFIQAQTMLKSGLTCAEKRLATDFHNELRRKVANGTLSGQPRASNMLKLVWDDALALIAQNWANKMMYQHNPSRPDPRFAVGENIYKSSSNVAESTFDMKKPIQRWYDENTIYQYKKIDGVSGTGHYTQIVWATTKYVGCGATYFRDTNGLYSKFYVCDYGQAGNKIGQYPYTTGTGCVNLCCTDQCGKLYGNNC